MSTSTSAPADTRKIAASTKDTAPKALILSLAKAAVPGISAVFSCHGRNIVASSSAAPAAKR
ncbi:MAG: hypothetical protein ACR2LK_10390 [Solirubrobacteraceae bacterium]